MKKIILIMSLLMMISCSVSESKEVMMNTGGVVGEVTLYYPNGTDTTIAVTDVKIYTSSETLIYYGINGKRNVTTIDWNYTQY